MYFFEKMKSVPGSLRIWFIVHFLVDLVFALPLIFVPGWLLSLFGFSVGELVTPRLVGAAFLAIGGTSFLIRNKSVESFETLLTLKIIWSVVAILGIILALLEGTSPFAWGVLGTYVLFFCVWVWYKRKN